MPLYVYPGKEWDQMANLARANRDVPIVAVINPANGPGIRSDPIYSLAIISLRSAGIKVLGYVATGYGAVSPAEAQALLERYRAWYSLDGAFFDEMATGPGTEDYYLGLSAYAKNLGLGMTFGNPGTWVSKHSAAAVDVCVIYEGRGLPTVPMLERQAAEGTFAFIAYGTKRLDSSQLLAASRSVSYAYVTDAEPPNPYASLPPYLGELAASLQAKPTPRL